MSQSSSKSVNCPTCQKAVIWSKENAFRPFCSKRCRLIDLGDWASENHRIAGDSVTSDVLSDDLERY